MEDTTKQLSTESLVLDVWPDTGRRLNLSKTTTWKLIHEGTIPSIKLGKRYLVPKAGLDALINGQQSNKA